MPAKKEILLVKPKFPVPTRETSGNSCLGLLYIGTKLKRCGYSPKIIDAEYDDAEQIIRSSLGNALCVGISAMTAQVRHGVAITRLVKKLNPKIPVIWGGTHPTLMPEQTLAHPDVDYVVVGEGEETFLELVRCLSKKSKKKLEDIAGLGFKRNGKLVFTKEAGFTDLNSLSPPAWELVDMERYFYKEILTGERCVHINSARGCVYNCAFCINTVLGKRCWRPLSVGNMIREMALLKGKYGIKAVRFIDENFTINRKRVEEFCNKCIESGINLPWVANARADYFNERHLNDELLLLMAKSGCKALCLGIESGSQRVLDRMRKGITPAQALHAVKKLGEHGITPVCMFMVGIPGEENGDIIATIRLIKGIKAANPGAKIYGPQLFRPYPGSELYDCIVQQHCYLEPDTLEGWAKKGNEDDIMFADFVKLDEMPWLKDKKFIERILFYMSIYQFNPATTDNKLKKIAAALLKGIVSLRIATGFYSLPIDKGIYEFAAKSYRKRLAGAGNVCSPAV